MSFGFLETCGYWNRFSWRPVATGISFPGTAVEISSLQRLVGIGASVPSGREPGLGSLACPVQPRPVCAFQILGPRARLWRRAVRLPGEERETDTQGGPQVLPPDRVSAGLLPQLLHLVRGQPPGRDDGGWPRRLAAAAT